MRLFWRYFWALGFSSICCALKQSNGFMTQIKLWIMGGEHTERKTKANWEHVPVPYSDNSSVLCLQKKNLALKNAYLELDIWHTFREYKRWKMINFKYRVKQTHRDTPNYPKYWTASLTFLNRLRLILIEMQHHDGFWKWWENLEMHLKAVFELPCMPPLFYEQKQA